MKLELPDFSRARVLIVGDLMLDRYWHGDTSRISPEAPVPVVRVGDVEERPGGAGNVALNIVALGGSATVIGLTGNDEAADSLQLHLETQGVTCRFERQGQFPTVTKLRVISRHQQLIRLDFEDGFPGYSAEGLFDHYQDRLADTDVIVLSDYGKGTLRSARALISAGRAAGKPVLIDPKGTDFERYRGATLITPNLGEFEAVVGICRDEHELELRAEQLRRELEIQALLVTRSERGVSLFIKDEPPLHLPTHAREVFDVTGAGDTVISTLAGALAAGASFEMATSLANLAAGVVVGKLGTATATVPELRQAMRQQEPLSRGVMDEEALVGIVRDARAHGERIVMTNGCFDILHAGHVAYLQQAAALGDRLIVAVNNDTSVRKLKGEGRPINPVEQRMVVLNALESVDWVIPFSEETPERLICKLLPDTLVKGGDYRPEEIAGGPCVQKAGGKIVILDFVDGCSTTRIVENIREQNRD
ncbi:bifunctional D-glycero-beta-D-manno-heptose-7-phosphate kinase/D-glycero-beta-D-manno-heptose 1-phosphate adenylyltransferase HldE [Thiohalomonas denitrificans]|uniref:Bifunctional protein HldE n=1 Tax=Thiohalomonas denitrificans TaxID=415747 RepID=A0A1G5PQT3_9GAMM|nr:bifunctional D-glycero-beta-D-manno-heptose-7-phosphate kinase/D-glycero-beta-D-manno-heptose 1-phosphate adenylyltransferase HldE [Thiohalomonas denitrificans]SCZ51944.1 D-alpha,beta-D-heptose 7-phosphate 1-kinase /D-beta-D-heptose 1-phosphate adenylyltransferase [Thiohalomonas denitrificans]